MAAVAEAATSTSARLPPSPNLPAGLMHGTHAQLLRVLPRLFLSWREVRKMKSSEMQMIPHDIPLNTRDRPRIPQRNIFCVPSLRHKRFLGSRSKEEKPEEGAHSLSAICSSGG
jgi:hypothetical protein